MNVQPDKELSVFNIRPLSWALDSFFWLMLENVLAMDYDIIFCSGSDPEIWTMFKKKKKHFNTYLVYLGLLNTGWRSLDLYIPIIVWWIQRDVISIPIWMALAQGRLIIIYDILVPPASVNPSFKRLNTWSLRNITWEAVPQVGNLSVKQ